MYPRAFEYERPGSVQEAVRILQADPEAKILAGGHSLLPVMKLRLASPGKLVDISRIAALKNISINGGLTLGAGVTYNELLQNDRVKSGYAALCEAAAHVGDVQVRNRGTVGGAAAHADPAADLPAAFLAYGAQFVAVGPNGERTIAADDFFVDILTTALEPDEVLTQIRVPAAKSSAYEKFAHPASGYAIVGVAAVVGSSGVRVAVTGATYLATRLTGVEQALSSGSLTADAINAAVENIGDLDYAGDHFASSEYRAHLTRVFARRALLRAAGA
ncbi:MAG TPA: xanthine dehydrogenase family protein subunit M [Thermomicrobiales bacterium]|nr:xanthine dehydrogenase family protein subunit M [Thermomicrobiales bacterium]